MQLYLSNKPTITLPPTAFCIWLKSNAAFFKLNINKTEVLLIGNKSIMSKCNFFTLPIDNSSVSPSLLTQAKSITSSYFHLCNINHLGPFLTPNNTAVLVRTLVTSHINYCNDFLFVFSCKSRTLLLTPSPELLPLITSHLLFSSSNSFHLKIVLISRFFTSLNFCTSAKQFTLFFFPPSYCPFPAIWLPWGLEASVLRSPPLEFHPTRHASLKVAYSLWCSSTSNMNPLSSTILHIVDLFLLTWWVFVSLLL